VVSEMVASGQALLLSSPCSHGADAAPAQEGERVRRGVPGWAAESLPRRPWPDHPGGVAALSRACPREALAPRCWASRAPVAVFAGVPAGASWHPRELPPAGRTTPAPAPREEAASARTDGRLAGGGSYPAGEAGLLAGQAGSGASSLPPMWAQCQRGRPWLRPGLGDRRIAAPWTSSHLQRRQRLRLP